MYLRMTVNHADLLDRKECNDQESIQLPNTFCSKTRKEKEKKDAPRAKGHNQTTTSRKPKGQFLSQKLAKRLSKVKKFTREIVNHSRRSALERSVKILLWGLNRFNLATPLALSSSVVYTRHLFSPRKRVPNSSVQHLREFTNQTNTDMKQR